MTSAVPARDGLARLRKDGALVEWLAPGYVQLRDGPEQLEALALADAGDALPLLIGDAKPLSSSRPLTWLTRTDRHGALRLCGGRHHALHD
jgi:hypothetical protein